MMDKPGFLEFPIHDSGLFRLTESGKWADYDVDFTHMTRSIDSYEIIVVHRGRLFMQEDSRKYELGPGHMLLLEPGLRHGGYQSDHTTFFWLHFQAQRNVARDHDYLKVLNERVGFAAKSDGLCIPKHATIAHPQRLFTALTDYLAACHSARLYRYERMLSSFQYVVFALLDGVVGPDSDIREPRDARLHHVWKMMRYIKEHCSKPLTVAEVAKAVHLNRDYANRLFRRVNACGILEYLIQARLEAAKALLEDQSLSIAQIADRVGYPDPYYFSRIFQRKSRLSPKQYRTIIYKCRN